MDTKGKSKKILKWSIIVIITFVVFYNPFFYKWYFNESLAAYAILLPLGNAAWALEGWLFAKDTAKEEEIRDAISAQDEAIIEAEKGGDRS